MGTGILLLTLNGATLIPTPSARSLGGILGASLSTETQIMAVAVIGGNCYEG